MVAAWKGDTLNGSRSPTGRTASAFEPPSPIRDRPRIHDRFLVRLRHGRIALGHFDGWFKMTILRSRFRPDCLGSKGSDGLDTFPGIAWLALCRAWLVGVPNDFVKLIALSCSSRGCERLQPRSALPLVSYLGGHPVATRRVEKLSYVCGHVRRSDWTNPNRREYGSGHKAYNGRAGCFSCASPKGRP
jgi:hypothetical protein